MSTGSTFLCPCCSASCSGLASYLMSLFASETLRAGAGSRLLTPFIVAHTPPVGLYAALSHVNIPARAVSLLSLPAPLSLLLARPRTHQGLMTAITSLCGRRTRSTMSSTAMPLVSVCLVQSKIEHTLRACANERHQRSSTRTERALGQAVERGLQRVNKLASALVSYDLVCQLSFSQLSMPAPLSGM